MKRLVSMRRLVSSVLAMLVGTTTAVAQETPRMGAKRVDGKRLADVDPKPHEVTEGERQGGAALARLFKTPRIDEMTAIWRKLKQEPRPPVQP